MKAIVTVVGHDKVGIIAKICIKLAEFNVNVLDISQTIMQANFTMIMFVDATDATLPFAKMQEELTKLGEEMDLSIRIQREELFDSMHSV